MAQKLTPEEMGRVREALAAGVDPERIKQIILQRQQTTEPVEPKQPEVSTETPGFFTEDVVPVSRETPILTSGKLGNIVAQQPTETVAPEPIQTDVLPSITGSLISKIPGSDIPEKFISEPLTAVAEESQAAAESFTTSATGEEGVKEGLSKAFGNIIPSLGKQGAGLIDMIANPIDTTEGVFSLATGIIQSATQPILNQIVGEDIVTDNQQMVSDLVSEIKETYGTPTKLWKEAQENPALILELVFSSVKKAGRTGKDGLSEKNQKKVDNLKKSAESQIGEFLSPSKNNTTRAARKITPEILERGITGTREEVLGLAKEQRKIYGKFIEEFEELGLKGEINLNDVDSVIDKFALRSNLIDFKGNPIAGQEAKLKALDDVMNTIRNVSKGEDFVDSNKLTTIRKAFDEVYKGTDESLDKFQNKLRKEVADELRRQFAKANPDMADVNKEFSFYANLDNVLDETVNRRFGKGEGGGIETKRTGQLGTIGGGIGALIGGAAGGGTGALAGALLGRQALLSLDSVMSSPKWKSVSAQKKSNLADAIVNGDKLKVEKIIDGIIIAQGLNIDLTTSEEQVKQDEESEAERQRILKMLQSR